MTMIDTVIRVAPRGGARDSRRKAETRSLQQTSSLRRAEVESNEKIVREAYRLAEGKTLDADGFRALFAENGSFNDMTTSQSFRGEQISQVVAGLAHSFPDVHRELLEVHAFGDVVAVELRIQGTHLGGFPSPVGEIPPTGNRVDVPAADLWYLRDGKIERFNCYNSMSVLFDQIGVHLDFKSAVDATETAATAE